MLAAYFNNGDIVAITQDADGKSRVTGSEISQTKATVNQDGGQGLTGTASTTVNLEAADLIPQPFYEGEIDDEDGTVNPQGSGSGE